MRKSKEGHDSVDFEEMAGLMKRYPAKQWVSMLLLHMVRRSVSHFTLAKSTGIPPVSGKGELELCDAELSIGDIINRLKVISGLNPVAYPMGATGKIELHVQGDPYTFDTTFTDDKDDSVCSIAMSGEKKEAG